MQSPSGMQQEIPIATGNNVVLGLESPVFQPIYRYFGLTQLSWNGRQESAPAALIQDNASIIIELADAITSEIIDSLPECNLAQYNGDPFQWLE